MQWSLQINVLNIYQIDVQVRLENLERDLMSTKHTSQLVIIIDLY